MLYGTTLGPTEPIYGYIAIESNRVDSFAALVFVMLSCQKPRVGSA
ncbi:hypothetical protein GFS31_27140 [Leptolyngbya sp. BL0902]|nr:hypothetical protein GFS31_27140 [Leptolyngbya sp. BL0902]